jgi:hypothetical protein
MAALGRFTAMPLDRSQAFSLLRSVASLCEELAGPPTGATGGNSNADAASNRIFNVAYYLIWSVLDRGYSGGNDDQAALERRLLGCFHDHARPLCADAGLASFPDAKRRIDESIALWLAAAGCRSPSELRHQRL